VLRQNLQQQGVKIDAIEVTVTQYEFRQNPNDDNAGRGESSKQQGRRSASIDGSVDDEDAITAAEEAQLLAAQMMDVSGGSLDLTA
jgi:flagellar hook-length control protein FliK